MGGKIKGIQFDKVSAQILSIEHTSRILIEWALEKTNQNISILDFNIYRGESVTELSKINADPIKGGTKYEYVDFTPKMINLDKRYYYQVIADEMLGGTVIQQFKSKIFSFEEGLDLVGLYVVEEHLFAHRHVYGMPSLIYKKYSEGARCPVCWDTVLKRSTRSNCTTCKGTGFSGGYYSPYEAWMDFNPDPKSAQIAEWGERNQNQTDIQFTNYPIIEVGDIIIELKTNRYWRVVNARDTEKNRSALLQVARLDEINRSDIEYRVEVPEDVRSRMVAELNERISTPEF